MAVRHYKTTSTRINGVTYRTTQSRRYLGRYPTPADKQAGHAAAIAGVVLGWPWIITALPVGGRLVVALLWYGLLGSLMKWSSNKHP